jgi:phosphatidylserine/phosphatidylglycerophosphate/cardiolipin synthase-like enzyme
VITRRFAERFVRQEGRDHGCPRSPTTPAAFEDDARRASLFAKCVVINGARALVGSAKFTEAAQLRNIEIGVIVDRPRNRRRRRRRASL